MFLSVIGHVISANPLVAALTDWVRGTRGKCRLI